MGERVLSIEGKARIDILKGALSAGKTGAHIAPSLSDVDICLAILEQFDEENDVFILSKGHGALGYYAAMHQRGMITDAQFDSFESNGGEFPGQPSRHIGNKIQYSSGSLGMGLSYGLGSALAKKNKAGVVYAVLGDGELNEGSNWEAAALAHQYSLENLIAVIDNNGLQSDGKCQDIVGQNLLNLWKAYGWETAECNGHSLEKLRSALKKEHKGKPLAIVAHTVKGKGVSFMENDNAWHHAVLRESDYDKAVQEIGDLYGLYQE